MACWYWHLIRSIAAAREDYKTMRGVTERQKYSGYPSWDSVAGYCSEPAILAAPESFQWLLCNYEL